MSKMEYNELGQLINKQLHETATDDFLQNVDFKYNIRSWLTKINDPTDLYNDTDNDNDLFAMQLTYNKQVAGLADPTKIQYNGNISAIIWGNKDEFNSDTIQGYGFTYDAVNRIKAGDFQLNIFNSWADQASFDMEISDYDKNGNIKKLVRKGFGLDNTIDDLTYEYGITNQLQYVDDASLNTNGFSDIAGSDYAYDNNGNLRSDNNKGIVNIRYNYLNLPEKIDFGGGDIIEYIYDAAGTKLAKFINGTETGDRYYIGNMEYNETQSLEFIHTNEGRVRSNGIDHVYDYYLKDHLGNTRVTFTESTITGGLAEALQVDNYYPFGMRFNQAPVIQKEENNYLYNGKELQEEYGLNWYDYGARFYDATLGRWHLIDPKTEKYYYESPFAYVSNNPIIFIDPDGQEKYKLQINLKWNTGIVGAGIKALGVKYCFEGAKEQEVSINISFDTDNKELTVGASQIEREKEKGDLSFGGLLGGGETSEKETGSEAKAGYDFKNKEFIAEVEPIANEDLKEVGEGTVGVFTGTEKEGEGSKYSIGLNPEINLGIVGTGIGVNLSVQESPDEKKE